MKKFNSKKMWAGFSAAAITAACTLTSSCANAAESKTVYGDANEDGFITVADATAVLQAIGNADRYGLSPQGADNADVYNRGDGLSGMDALTIQKYELGLISQLPESWKDQQDPETASAYIHLKGDSAEVEGDYAEVNGSVITISHSGSFYIDGTLNDGQINVNIPDETADPDTVKIFLNGVNITGKSAPAILITNAENTSLNLMDGTDNIISDGDTAYSGDNLGAAVIEAKDDITIKGGELGTGTLSVTANTQNAIVCNNDIKFTGGVTTITTLNATDKTNAVNGKTSVTVKGGTLNIDAEGDGLKSSKGSVSIESGSVNIKAGNDAVQAETTIDISGGTVLGGGDRGLTSLTGTNITGGIVVVTATDNQTDSAVMSGTTQGTMLLNCITSTETDGCWKKANALCGAGAEFTKWEKKYTYAVISSPEITNGNSYTLRNAATGANASFGANNSTNFTMTGTVTVFDSVNPLGDGTVVDPPAVDPASYSITLNGASIQSDAPADTASVADGVMTISKPGVFALSGKASEVQIVVDVDKTAYPTGVVELDLMGAELSNSTTAPIYVSSIGDEVQIVSKSGTVNTISDGTSHTQTYTDSDGNVNTVEGAIFARDDIKFKGTGSLTVNGNTDDAVVCKNDIKIYNGALTVNAVDDGIRGKDSVTVGNDTAVDHSGLKLTVKTQNGDGIKSTSTDESADKSYGLITINGGTIEIDAYADGIQAEQEVVINGGDINISTYEGSAYTNSSSNTSTGGNRPGMGGGMSEGNDNKVDFSAKGIKAVGILDASTSKYKSGGNITINGGNITVDSTDDCIHCGGDMVLVGGVMKLASADDGLHSDHTLTIGQGTSDTYDDVQVIVSKGYEGVEAVSIVQNSGTVICNVTDDGFNAAGGDQSYGSTLGWGSQGGWTNPQSGNYSIDINGGFVLVNVADGDHDGFDSNGDLIITGGIAVSNGNEAFDCDGQMSCTGGVFVENTGSGGMGGGMGGGSLTANITASGSVSAGTRITLVGSDNQVIVSFIAGKAVSNFKAGGSVTSGTFYTGGTLEGSTYFQTIDDSQLAAYGGTLTGGTALSGGSSSENQRPW